MEGASWALRQESGGRSRTAAAFELAGPLRVGASPGSLALRDEALHETLDHFSDRLAIPVRDVPEFLGDVEVHPNADK